MRINIQHIAIIYNYNNNIYNNIKYDIKQPYNIESKEIKQNNDFKNNINSIYLIKNNSTNNSCFTDNMKLNNKTSIENKPVYKNQNKKPKAKNKHLFQNNFDTKKYYDNLKKKKHW